MARERFSISLDEDLANKLKKIVEETEVPTSRIVARALRLYFDSLEREEQKKDKVTEA